MRARFRDSMTWLHTWSGLVVGWILFAVFLTGTVSFFQDEISAWMRPQVSQAYQPLSALEDAQQYLQNNAPGSSRWSITLPDERLALTTLFWRDPDAGGRGFRRVLLDSTGEETKVRDTRGGEFLYRFHFDLHYLPVSLARWIVGISAMFMLVAIITGIVIHKKIFKDFFTLQPGKGARSWLDAHTLTSVLALPFHLMITYTGLVTLMFLYLSWSVSLGFSDSQQLFEKVFSQAGIPAVSNRQAEMQPLTLLYHKAEKELADAPISTVTVHNPGDENAVVQFSQASTASLISRYVTLTYSATTGELLAEESVDQAAELTRRTIINLHAGRFADLHLRWLYFLSGLAGTMMIASGLLLWSKKRRQKTKSSSSLSGGHRLVDNLNAGFLLGVPFAIATYFAANRLLPLDLANRADMEIHCFFAGWLIMLLYPIFRGVSNTWREGTALVGVAYLLLPLLSMLTIDKHLLSYSYSDDITLWGMDFVLVISGVAFLSVAWHQHGKQKLKENVIGRETRAMGGPTHEQN